MPSTIIDNASSGRPPVISAEGEACKLATNSADEFHLDDGQTDCDGGQCGVMADSVV
jgi:hypothetical protein